MEHLWELFGVFLGGATPFVEGESAVSVGILLGLPPTAVIIAALAGNLLTVALAAVLGTRVHRWRQRRSAHRIRTVRQEHRRLRSERVFARWGLPGLAILGPPAVGTHLSAVTAVGLGVEPRRAFLWIGSATLFWCGLYAALSLMGVSWWTDSGMSVSDVIQIQTFMAP